MAKKQIVGAIGPIGGIVYRAGMEDQLAAAAAAEKIDLSRFTEEGGPLEGDWSTSTASKPAQQPKQPATLGGVDFASKAAREAATAAGLTAEDFKGVKATGETGYTAPDVQSIVDGRDK